MDTVNMNTELGTKWFTFFTKVRPWLGCVSIITTVVDFFQYIDVYFSYWWMLLYFAATIASAVVGIMVFSKSMGDYRAFVSFVNKALIFETFAFPYTSAVQTYVDHSFDPAIACAAFVVTALLSYFLWYRLNIKYFRKRLIDTAEVEALPASDAAAACFCPQCGSKLIENSIFCSSCGNRIAEN